MITLEIDSTQTLIPDAVLERAAQATLDLSGVSDADLTLVLTGDPEIQASTGITSVMTTPQMCFPSRPMKRTRKPAAATWAISLSRFRVLPSRLPPAATRWSRKSNC